MNMSFVAFDPFVMDEMVELYGTLPQKYRGYTRSGASLDKLKKGIMAYDHEYPDKPNDPLLNEAIDHTFKVFSFKDKQKPLKHSEVPLEADSSAGWTWSGLRKKEVYSSALRAAVHQTQLLYKGKYSRKAVPPCMAFKRTQLARLPKTKVRLVWGFPIEVTIREGRFAVPLVDLFERMDSPIFHGKTLLKELPIFIDSLFVNGGTAYVTDWSGFDSTIPPWLIKICFKILRMNLDLSAGDDKEFWELCDYFIKTPIVLPDGDVFVKNGGIPSGSYFTQLIGSIANFLLSSYLQLRTLDRFLMSKCLGDDLIGRLRKDETIDFDEWTRIAKEMFNMNISSTKSAISDTPWTTDFLGHSSRNGRVLRDNDKLMQLALYPEYQVDDPAVSTARVLGLVMDSGMRNLPLLLLYHRMASKYTPDFTYRERFMKYVVQSEIPQVVNDGQIWIRS